ncbi:MAG: penicillin-binding transpeptidase domain-containing protein [Candidatus Manganitrophus sp.]|nr:penicillin-binding transpeptidase domain-containing protein [Candidatus Manganitrophus sp.]
MINDHDPVGVVPFRQVIAKSSNIGTAKVAQRLGEKRMFDYIRAFGFGERLGIDLLGEMPGLVRRPEAVVKALSRFDLDRSGDRRHPAAGDHRGLRHCERRVVDDPAPDPAGEADQSSARRRRGKSG